MYLLTDKAINKTKTRKAVELCLERYKKVKRILEIEREYGVGNHHQHPIVNDKNRDEVTLYIRKIEYALNGLSEIQNELIYERYLKNNEVQYDYLVQETIQVAARTYYKIKLEALLNLAEEIQVVVYDEPKDRDGE